MISNTEVIRYSFVDNLLTDRLTNRAPVPIGLASLSGALYTLNSDESDTSDLDDMDDEHDDWLIQRSSGQSGVNRDDDYAWTYTAEYAYGKKAQELRDHWKADWERRVARLGEAY